MPSPTPSPAPPSPPCSSPPPSIRSHELTIRYDDGEEQDEALWEMKHMWLRGKAKPKAESRRSGGTKGHGVHSQLFCGLCNEWMSPDNFSAQQARDGLHRRYCLRHSSSSSFGAKVARGDGTWSPEDEP